VTFLDLLCIDRPSIGDAKCFRTGFEVFILSREEEVKIRADEIVVVSRFSDFLINWDFVEFFD
jgi:hypothetical protein